MEKLESVLENFKEIVNRLNEGNLVLGGTNALRLHGLELGRDPSDVDLIIYKPSSEQLKTLNIINSSLGTDSALSVNYTQKVTKLVSFDKSKKLDILISEEEIPKGLLTYSSNIGFFKVQSVSNVIRAKSSYKKHFKDNTRSLFYISQKDVEDLQNLKNLNFNLDFRTEALNKEESEKPID